MITIGTARAAADLAEGFVLATVEVPSPPERAFHALASDDVLRWDPAHRASRQACAATCIVWETSFEELARILA